MTGKIAPVHPGEVLLEEFLKPLNMSQRQLAKDLGVNPSTINRIVNGYMKINAKLALKLAETLNTTPEFWLMMQIHFDLEKWKDTHNTEV